MKKQNVHGRPYALRFCPRENQSVPQWQFNCPVF